jgi:5-methylcytosine-specific restriction protein B
MRYWGIRVGIPGQPDLFVTTARRLGFISIGWNDLGDLSRFRNEEELKNAYQEAYSTVDAPSIYTIWNFVNGMNIGDIVLLPHLGERVVYVGNIVGPYVYTKSWDDSCGHLHRRRVEWFKDIGWDYLSERLRNTLSTPATLRNLDDYVYEIEFHLISKRY